MGTGIIVAGLALLSGFYLLYVRLVKCRNNVREAASGIDVQLKKRYDLIPNMLKAAQKFMEHEKDIFFEVTKLREKALNADTYADKFKADADLSTALRSFNVKAENYPALKSDATMVAAQEAMSETEEHIAAARRFYNSAVKEYKNAIEIFPSSLVAAILSFADEYPFFEADSAEKAGIDVNNYFK